MRSKVIAALACWALITPALSPGVAHAQDTPTPPAPAASPGTQCHQAIQAAERAARVLPQLMSAIGRVESGRVDARGIVQPWPWTINAEGTGQYFETKEAALAAVRDLQARGVTSIDVGCMQVNLHHHPAAFASLEQAFDPAANAAYAARYLNELYAATRDWARATAFYHSATPERGNDYRRRVAAALPRDTRRLIDVPTPAGNIWSRHAFSANAWNSTGPSGSGAMRTGVLANSGRPLNTRRVVTVPGTGTRL